ncbi:MAG: MaoC/PaaZ C-terminal domain-containing protein [Pseudomonadota bacterium]
MAELRYFEDLEVGEQLDLGQVALTEADIIAFAKQYDPQPMHLDPEAGRATVLKGLAASGWHTCAAATPGYVRGFSETVRALGGAGVDYCRWIKPCYPAERAGPIHISMEIEALKRSQSRPELGFVGVRVDVRQRDPDAGADAEPRLICAQAFRPMVETRGPASAAPRPAQETRADPRALAGGVSEAVSPAEGFAFANAGEVTLGQRTALGESAFTAEEIIAFAQAFDPHWFHLSEEAGRRSFFKGLAASGWEVMCRGMRKIVEARIEAIGALPADRAMAAMEGMGPSPGFRNLRWLRPTYAGDTLRYFMTPFEFLRREGRSWVVLRMRIEAVNQRGEPVARSDNEVLLRP